MRPAEQCADVWFCLATSRRDFAATERTRRRAASDAMCIASDTRCMFNAPRQQCSACERRGRERVTQFVYTTIPLKASVLFKCYNASVKNLYGTRRLLNSQFLSLNFILSFEFSTESSRPSAPPSGRRELGNRRFRRVKGRAVYERWVKDVGSGQ